jgi:hypothetical protein
MRLPVPNISSAITDAAGMLVTPWNSWFQQFSQKAPKAIAITAVSYNSISPGSFIVTSGTPTISLIRGIVTITMTGQKVVPMSIGDIVTFSGAYTGYFLGN